MQTDERIATYVVINKSEDLKVNREIVYGMAIHAFVVEGMVNHMAR